MRTKRWRTWGKVWMTDPSMCQQGRVKEKRAEHLEQTVSRVRKISVRQRSQKVAQNRVRAVSTNEHAHYQS